MDLAHIVLLIAVAIAVIAIAGYLIAVAVILKRVVERLVVVIGAVQAVTETAQPVGAIVGDINKDLDSGRKLIEGCVERLEASRVPVGATAEPSSRHEAAEPSPDPVGGATATAPPPRAGEIDADQQLDQPPPETGRGWFKR